MFALVVARALDPLTDFSKVPGVGLSHIAVAFFLTVTSWIGYHNSWSRPRYFIRFANWPLWQFAVDVLLVVIYWFTAVSAEGTGTGLGHHVSARPEVLLVAISFIFYSVWDAIGLAIRRSDLYYGSPISRDVPCRRHVTIACALAALAFAVVIWLVNPRTSVSIITVDGLLIALILVFRFAKDLVTPDDAYVVDRRPAPSSGLVSTWRLGTRR